MKTILSIAVIVVLLALDWAALHDILKDEPNPYAEHAMIVFSLIIFGAMFFTWQRSSKSKQSAVGNRHQ